MLFRIEIQFAGGEAIVRLDGQEALRASGYQQPKGIFIIGAEMPETRISKLILSGRQGGRELVWREGNSTVVRTRTARPSPLTS